MIVSAIIGGLGNQMFQYAAARSLAARHQRPLLLDLADFNGYTLHNGYELQRVFAVDAPPASPAQVAGILGWRNNKWVRKVLKRRAFGALRGAHLAIEPHFNYWPGLASLHDDVYMMGYWQSERYFSQHASLIRQDFAFRAPLSGLNAELASQMQQCASVAVHVRRGDYLSHKKTADIMHSQGIDYYRAAAERIAGLVAQPRYYVFSDDIEWVRQHFDFLGDAVMIDHNKGAQSYLDMQLMSLCRHNIIANSSFSWWGAWLNANPEKIVIAPRAWFRNGFDDSDLVPPTWARL